MASAASTLPLFGKQKLECGTFYTTELRSHLAYQEKRKKNKIQRREHLKKKSGLKRLDFFR